MQLTRKSIKQSLLVGSVFSLALALIFFIQAFGFSTAKQVKANLNRRLPIYCVERDDKKIAISFDCAWGTEYTDAILRILAQNDIKCTFFAVEFWVEKNPEHAKKIVDAGHELGTHSKTHSYMSKQNEKEIRDELTSSSAVIERVTGKKPTLFRAPYGDYDDLLIETANEQGLSVIQWDVDSLDWKDLSSGEIYNRVIKKVKNGSIVLFHNQGLNTAEALTPIIKELKKQQKL